MKKIAIITIQSLNYGNRLQNYALQEVLNKYGLCKTVYKNNYSIKLSSKIKNYIKILRSKTKADYFSKFNLNIKYETRYIANNKNIAKKYNYFVAGSDQIWNPLFKFNDDIEFLSFANDDQKIAYAASIGLSDLPEEYVDVYKERLKGFKAISMREEAGTKIVKDLTGRTDVMTVLDPTLLLEKNKWNEISKKSKFQPDKPYVFKYILGIDNHEIDLEIEKIAKSKNLEIFDLKENSKGDDRPIGPAEFISLIANSEMVFTDSFHGTVFSLIYECPFYTILRPVQEGYGDMSSRIDTLLNMVNMTNRMVRTVNDIESITCECAFETAKKIIDKKRMESLSFLDKNLK